MQIDSGFDATANDAGVTPKGILNCSLCSIRTALCERLSKARPRPRTLRELHGLNVIRITEASETFGTLISDGHSPIHHKCTFLSITR